MVNICYHVVESVSNFEMKKYLSHEEVFNDGTIEDRREKAFQYLHRRMEGFSNHPGFFAPFRSFEEAKGMNFKNFSAYSLDVYLVLEYKVSDFQSTDSGLMQEGHSFLEDPEETLSIEKLIWLEQLGILPPPLKTH